MYTETPIRELVSYSVEEEYAYDAGWAYAEDNADKINVEDNPYPKDTDEYVSWYKGFIHCYQDINNCDFCI